MADMVKIPRNFLFLGSSNARFLWGLPPAGPRLVDSIANTKGGNALPHLLGLTEPMRIDLDAEEPFSK